MSEQPAHKSPPLAPFVMADVLFLGIAVALLVFSHHPLLWWEASLIVACGAAAAWTLITPILRQDSNQQGQAQAVRFGEIAAELQKVEALSAHIHAATAQWKAVETQSSAALNSAQQLSESLAQESRMFGETLQKVNDNEKAHLRLEVEKLRRSEGEWLQAFIRTLDHVFALFQAAQRTGQRSLIDQINLFQDSCREAARRVGLAPVVPRIGEPFDPRGHQIADNSEPPANALVTEVVATGFTYQGQFIRRAYVAVQAPPEAEASQQGDFALTQETEP